jgi:hypothetical protein
MSDAYTTSEVNALADDTPWTLSWIQNVAGAGSAYILRFLLVGGPPHGTSPVAHLALLKALAVAPSVDFEEYDVLGACMIEVPEGAVLLAQNGDKHVTGQSSYVADVVFRMRARNAFWPDEGEREQALRAALSGWGGGYTPQATQLAISAPDPNTRITAAIEFWKQQPPLFYVREGQEPEPQMTYSSQVNTGTLGVGFSTGLADYPGRCVPLKWSSQLVTPQPGGGGGAQIPVITPPPGTTQPGQPGAAKPAGKLSQGEALAVFGACGVAGYLLYKRFAGG